jgi:hypothetical protein
MSFTDTHNMIRHADTGIPDVTYDQFVANLFRPLAPASMFTHAVLGMVTEYHEACTAKDRTNFIEECGDYLFFMTAALQQLPPTTYEDDELHDHAHRVANESWQFFPDSGIPSEDDMEPSMADAAQFNFNPLLDIAKRWLAYDKAPNDEQAKQAMLCATYGFLLLHSKDTELQDLGTIEEVIPMLVKTNVAKLKHRYRDGFSTHAALNRNVEGELRDLSRVSGV